MSENNEDSFIILGETSSLFDSLSLLQLSQTNGKSTNEEQTVNETQKIDETIDSSNKENITLNSNSIQSNRSSFQPSLAEGFLLGAIDCETMKVC